jgi:hypothetical protein
MLLQTTDFNRAGALIDSTFQQGWRALKRVLERMPLHLKASDQHGIQGTPIFDPVGTNEYIKAALRNLRGWRVNIPIPAEYDFLGTGVDFCRGPMLVEIQFSNYPFLLNNTVRSELFYKAKTPLAGKPVELAVIVTKAKMFPASNSTLYYEQAQKQLTALAKNHVFDVPIRLVGLFSPESGAIPIRYTKYSATRYSRTVVKRVPMQCQITGGKTGRSRCILRVTDQAGSIIAGK